MPKVYVKKTEYPCKNCDGWGVLEIPDFKSYEKKVIRQKCSICDGSGMLEKTEVFQEKGKPFYE